MDTPPASIETSDPSATPMSLSYYLWPAVRYGIAAIGIGFLGLRLGSWLFAPLALLAGVQAIRIAMTGARALSDHRRFGALSEEGPHLVTAGRFDDLLASASGVVAGSRTKEFRAWGLEWASYAAIQADDSAAMSDLLAAALQSAVPLHVPAQLHAALGNHEEAVRFYEASLQQRGDEGATLGLVHALAASGDLDRVQRVLDGFETETLTTPLREWAIWCKLEQDMVEEAAELSKALEPADVSPWGMSVCQVATMRCGDHERSLSWGSSALEIELHPSIESVVRYNRACSLAQLGKADDALGELALVGDDDLICAGPDDEDLEPLWHLPEFKRLVSATDS